MKTTDSGVRSMHRKRRTITGEHLLIPVKWVCRIRTPNKLLIAAFAFPASIVATVLVWALVVSPPMLEWARESGPINGQVDDENGPLVDAQVIVAGRNEITFTDRRGRFTLDWHAAGPLSVWKDG